ncbi:unnamed protein product [Somion occarium]|uniref:Uncharacterized protein n=1 Tax=Somion occarium TaxID=3059160 RepID=A0ABP1CNN4_9APHY
MPPPAKPRKITFDQAVSCYRVYKRCQNQKEKTRLTKLWAEKYNCSHTTIMRAIEEGEAKANKTASSSSQRTSSSTRRRPSSSISVTSPARQERRSPRVTGVRETSLEIPQAPADVIIFLNKFKLGHLAPVFRERGYSTVEDIDGLIRLPGGTQEAVLNEFKRDKRMCLKEWALIHAEISTPQQ